MLRLLQKFKIIIELMATIKDEQFDLMISQMQKQADMIQSNRRERSQKFHQCLDSFQNFLERQTQLLQQSQPQNNVNKQLISSTFENTFLRVLNASDVTIRKIKQTFNEKKQFWDSVIKLNSQIPSLQVKKQFYLEKKDAQQNYFQAMDHQKDKHKSYAALVNKIQKKELLRDYQENNRTFQQKVHATASQKQWKVDKTPTSYYPSQHQGTLLNKFIGNTYQKTNNLRPVSYQGDNSGLFLNNFTRKI